MQNDIRHVGCLDRRDGVALILVAVMALGLLMLSVVSLNMTREQSIAQVAQLEVFSARQIAESGAAHALVRIKQAGIVTPQSGGGANATWVTFDGGEYFYTTTFDATTRTNTIRSWGRVAVAATVSGSTVSPEHVSWDPSGYLVQGVEVVVKGRRFVPETPLFFGNGGVQKPLGGFDWSGGSDPSDPSTWGVIASGDETSWQDSSIPFQTSALDYPYDYLYSGGSPTPATSNPHPYKIWGSQNPIGQRNVEAWFTNSGGTGYDPTVNVTPPPTSSYFDTSDQTSPDYPYPVDSTIPDVQMFAHDIWNTFSGAAGTTLLSDGDHSGTFGDLSTPGVTIVTGGLRVPAGQTFKGTGVLLIRDDYDPNVDTDNTPSTRADLFVDGTFEWTGLVLVAGWTPNIESSSGSSTTIVGALMGEDSVQSGGEVSLDSATINMRFYDDFRVFYSNALFAPGGLIEPFLPESRKEVVGSRDL